MSGYDYPTGVRGWDFDEHDLLECALRAWRDLCRPRYGAKVDGRYIEHHYVVFG